MKLEDMIDLAGMYSKCNTLAPNIGEDEWFDIWNWLDELLSLRNMICSVSKCFPAGEYKGLNSRQILALNELNDAAFVCNLKRKNEHERKDNG